ncbi:Methionyl-tRNA formyltransferase [compost metagenome]
MLGGKKLKLHKVRALSDRSSVGPGRVASVNEESITIATGDGVLKIFELQPESRNRMKVADFLKGNPLKVGDQIGV